MLEKLEIAALFRALHVRTAAEIRIVALRIGRDRLARFHAADQILLVRIVLEHLLGFFLCHLMTDNELVRLGALLHFLFDLRQILIRQRHIAKIHIVVESLFHDRTDPELCLRVQMLDSLCHQMGTAVVENAQILVFLEINHPVSFSFRDIKGVPRPLEGRLISAVPPCFLCRENAQTLNDCNAVQRYSFRKQLPGSSIPSSPNPCTGRILS